MDRPFRVVRAVPEDLPELEAIEVEAFPSGSLQIAEELLRTWARVWVARDDSSIAAFALCWHVVDELHLLAIATARGARRKGAARTLMAEVLTYARIEGVRLILLEVRASNEPALTLYRALGFAMTHLRKGYYSDGEDAVEMALSRG